MLTKSEETMLLDAAARAIKYRAEVSRRTVPPLHDAAEQLSEKLSHQIPKQGVSASEVIRVLDEVGSPATMATTNGRFFGLVVGGTLPAALAANWLSTAWDQNACFRFTSPIAATLEDVALRWLACLLGLPQNIGGAFVTGASMANLSALAAARHAILARAGWDVEAKGLSGAPSIRIVVSDEVHVTVLKVLALLGLGRDNVLRVPTDGQGRIRPDQLPELDERTIVCIQAGNVNTGNFDPAGEIVQAARARGSWVHVDGAFGLWALAHPKFAELMQDYSLADSWATDAHKWLNVPYDNGIVLLRDVGSLGAAMTLNAAYLPTGNLEEREPSHYTPESSRRARGVDVWAALLNLGTDGVVDLVDRSCRHARTFAEGLSSHGYEILNEVILNQVLVSFGSEEKTKQVVENIQAGGVLWCGTTVWQNRVAMRISVSNYATTDGDVQTSLAAMLRAAASD